VSRRTKEARARGRRQITINALLQKEVGTLENSQS
jgi:hypothetical protein